MSSLSMYFSFLNPTNPFAHTLVHVILKKYHTVSSLIDGVHNAYIGTIVLHYTLIVPFILHYILCSTYQIFSGTLVSPVQINIWIKLHIAREFYIIEGNSLPATVHLNLDTNCGASISLQTKCIYSKNISFFNMFLE